MTARRPTEYRPKAINWTVTLYHKYLADKVTIDPNATTLKEKEEWFKNSEFKYAIFGREICPETKKPHLQGFVSCHKQKLMTQMKKLFPDGFCHLEIAIGSPKQNKDYCSKEMDFVEYGECPLGRDGAAANAREAQKADYIEAKSLAIEGKLDDISADIYIRHYSALNSIASDHQKKLKSLPFIDCEWHIGPTGCGKSRSVREAYPDAYIKDCEPKRTHFWGGYAGESVVICEDIDNFNVGMGRQLKIWTDHYPFPTEAKFKGSQLIRPEKVIVTSNWTIRDIWTDERTYLPLERRFKIIEYDGNGRIGPIEGVELPEPVRLDNSHLRPRPILVEKEKPICKICYYKPCQCMVDMVIDDSCKRSTPDHSDCEYSDDLLDM